MDPNEYLNISAKKIVPIEKYVSLCVFPILAAYSDRKFELFGSCGSVSINNKKYLCTASHVLNNVKKANTTVVAGMAGKFIVLKLADAKHLINEHIDFDMCLIPCESAPPEVNFILESNFYDNESFEIKKT